jgi:hypothetical protein
MLIPEIYFATKLAQDQPAFKNVKWPGVTRMCLQQDANYTHPCYRRLTNAEHVNAQRDFKNQIIGHNAAGAAMIEFVNAH